ncbi:hypothetical protein Y1Q_0012120 [Alligator mississippiensis]|uniref:Uncharacterized protein n=1 Tax=Alligator mississippiensis TaxID=8496 RepID=A0A151P5Z3_ALLMI|nr:hypothetical protein Y1Q_0012120 [Alligator mississippiensis]
MSCEVTGRKKNPSENEKYLLSFTIQTPFSTSFEQKQEILCGLEPILKVEEHPHRKQPLAMRPTQREP